MDSMLDFEGEPTVGACFEFTVVLTYRVRSFGNPPTWDHLLLLKDFRWSCLAADAAMAPVLPLAVFHHILWLSFCWAFKPVCRFILGKLDCIHSHSDQHFTKKLKKCICPRECVNFMVYGLWKDLSHTHAKNENGVRFKTFFLWGCLKSVCRVFCLFVLIMINYWLLLETLSVLTLIRVRVSWFAL